MARILCLETATDVCSVAIAIDGRLQALHEIRQAGDHAAQITLLISRSMDAAGLDFSDLDALAISSGPGSYTSLRIGWSTAKGLAYSLGIPMLRIDTLQALAVRAQQHTTYANAIYCPMIDARRMEVYCAWYDAQANALSEPEAIVLTPESFDYWFDKGYPIVFTGNGAAKYEPLMLHRPEATFIPLETSADTFPILAEAAFLRNDFIDPTYAEPYYLKPPNVTKPKAVL